MSCRLVWWNESRVPLRWRPLTTDSWWTTFASLAESCWAYKDCKKQLSNQQQITMSHEIHTINIPGSEDGAHFIITPLITSLEWPLIDFHQTGGFEENCWNNLVITFMYLCHINVRMSCKNISSCSTHFSLL